MHICASHRHQRRPHFGNSMSSVSCCSMRSWVAGGCMPQGGRSSYDRLMTDEADGHVPVTRRQRDEHMSAWFERDARSRGAAAEPYWGLWCIPQSQLPVLPTGVAGAAAVEL